MANCFVHASDLHLDAPLGSLGLLDAQRRARLAERAVTAWDRLVKLCIDEDASFLVLAGDVFDSAIAGVGVQLRFQRGLRRLSEAGVAVFICHGNHDPLSNDFHPVGELPPNVVRFAPGEPQTHKVSLRDSNDTVLVSGVSFGTGRETENLALRFNNIERPPGEQLAPHVAVLHANVGANPGHDPYAPCSYTDLDTAPVDYWALGHIHKREIRRLPGGAWAAYSGNLQGRSFKPAECEPKGALVVPIDAGHIGEPRFEPCDEVRFVHSEVKVEPQDTIGDIADGLCAGATDLGQEHAPRPVAWTVRLRGVSSDAARLRGAIERGELASELADDLADRLNAGGLCGIENAVRSAVDRDAILAGGDLRADVLRDLQSLRESATDGGSGAEEWRARLRRALPPVLTNVVAELLDESEDRLDGAFALAEELLLEIYADGGVAAQ